MGYLKISPSMRHVMRQVMVYLKANGYLNK